MQDVNTLRKICEDLNLSGSDRLKVYTDESLVKIYNGAGPDKWFSFIRDTLTKAMEKFEPAIMIHDVQFFESDGSREGFDNAEKCWKDNCRIIFNREFPLFTWKQLNSSYRRARAYWLAVMYAGNIAISSESAFSAWILSYKKGKKL